MEHNHPQVVIIGAGPAGLATAGCLVHHGCRDFVVLDAAPNLGQSWRQHYDRLHLHTVKRLSHLPHMVLPEAYPTYASREQVVDYLEAYAEKMDIKPILSTKVQSVSKEGDVWKVTTDKESYITSHVVIAAGVNRIPHEPSWPDQETYKGKILHSRFYKNLSSITGDNVMVIGMGNTGSEIALDLANADKNVFLSVRSPISLVPRDLNGRPVQETARVLAKVPFGIGDWLGSQIRKIYFGDVSKYGLEISKVHPTVQLRETGKTPVIDLGTIEAIKQGKIKVLKDVDRFTSSGIITKDNQEVTVDTVLLATGYRAKVEEFMPSVVSHLNEHDIPKSILGTGALAGAYFIGYDNYKLGGILGTIRDDSQKIADLIISKL